MLPIILAPADTGEPLHRRLYFALRDAILDGRLAEGVRLTSSRALAAQMGLARNTVLAAYDQLTAEGFVEARPGSGTSTYLCRAASASIRSRVEGEPTSSSEVNSTVTGSPVAIPARANCRMASRHK